MFEMLLHADRILRGRDESRVAEESPARATGRFLVYTVAAGMLYGAVMGTFGGFGGDRLWQIFYSAIKVPLLLSAAFGLALPSFFVLNTLLGVREHFREVLRALLAAQAGLTLVLAALAPYTALWYVSFAEYQPAILFNAVLFGTASLAAQSMLRRAYRPLIARNRRHRLLLRVWLALYAFVGIQMGWILRPFVGAPHMPAQFFREDTWGNAYVIVGRMIWDLVFGG